MDMENGTIESSKFKVKVKLHIQDNILVKDYLLP